MQEGGIGAISPIMTTDHTRNPGVRYTDSGAYRRTVQRGRALRSKHAGRARTHRTAIFLDDCLIALISRSPLPTSSGEWQNGKEELSGGAEAGGGIS